MLLSVIFICYLFSVIFQSYLIDLIQSWTKYLWTFSRFSTTSPHNKQLDGTRLLSTETECLSYLTRCWTTENPWNAWDWWDILQLCWKIAKNQLWNIPWKNLFYLIPLICLQSLFQVVDRLLYVWGKLTPK